MRDLQRWQVWVGEVAVIGRIFLGAHGAGFARVGVEQHGGLLDGVAVFDLLDLPADFVVNRLLHELERVQVLDLAARAQRLPPGLRTDTLASQRKLPSCMLPSQMPIQVTILCSSLA